MSAIGESRDASVPCAPDFITIPIGEPVTDGAIIAGITQTVQEVLACFSAGDFARATALFTDDLVLQFGPGPDETRDDVAGFLEASPVPYQESAAIELLAITDVMLLQDGRVGAFVVDREPDPGTVYVVFEQVGERWLADEVFEFVIDDEGEESSSRELSVCPPATGAGALPGPFHVFGFVFRPPPQCVAAHTYSRRLDRPARNRP